MTKRLDDLYGRAARAVYTAYRRQIFANDGKPDHLRQELAEDNWNTLKDEQRQYLYQSVKQYVHTGTLRQFPGPGIGATPHSATSTESLIRALFWNEIYAQNRAKIFKNYYAHVMMYGTGYAAGVRIMAYSGALTPESRPVTVGWSKNYDVTTARVQFFDFKPDFNNLPRVEVLLDYNPHILIHKCTSKSDLWQASRVLNAEALIAFTPQPDQENDEQFFNLDLKITDTVRADRIAKGE